MWSISRCVFLVLILVYFTIGESPRWDFMRQHDYEIDIHHIEIPWQNKSYVKIEKFEFVKFNRTFQRVLNVSGYTFKEIGTDLKVKIQLYKLLSNQYKFFPLTATFHVCKEYERNSFGARDALEKTSNVKPCPLKPGYYYVKHLNIDATKLPPLIPSGHFKVSGDVYNEKDMLMKYEAFASIIYKVKLEEELKGFHK